MKGELPAFSKGLSSSATEGQKGSFLAAGLILATVIKPLNEQIRGLFTKSAPLIALFDQFQNPFW